ncbi:MAG TPA: cytidylate kinase-like family protein [Candidatus Polarisedimenticolia bacterium]|nr:cytidylate kinase-like family protein [Candidatus Polarisedimenticolia bacterium]
MNSQDTQIGFDKFAPFIESQLRVSGIGSVSLPQETPKLAITISRQSGSGGHAVGEKLAQYLQAHSPQPALPWMVFDRNLVEQVLEDHHLPQHLVRLMPEDRVSDLTDMLHQMFGLHPPFWTLVHQTSETILRLAKQGSVILIGRGANLATKNVPHAFHVRLVGSLERRIEHTRQIRNVDRKTALDLIQREDDGRKRYLKKYFNQDIDDPLLYDCILNTDLVSYDDAARLIADAALRQVEKQSPAHRARAISSK